MGTSGIVRRMLVTSVPSVARGRGNTVSLDRSRAAPSGPRTTRCGAPSTWTKSICLDAPVVAAIAVDRAASSAGNLLGYPIVIRRPEPGLHRQEAAHHPRERQHAE